ncbi:MAG: YceI family protein [Flavobacteriales bacterium]
MRNLLLLLLVLIKLNLSAQVVKSNETVIEFYSATPVEDIKAINKDSKALINTKTNEFAFVVPIVGFKFEKELMEVHFNENYMESDKYKTAYFKGTINGLVDYLTDGVYTVIASGTLNIHGVDQAREINAEINVKEGIISIKSEFKVKLANHKIKIPKVVIKNIAEEVSVSVTAVLNQKQQ